MDSVSDDDEVDFDLLLQQQTMMTAANNMRVAMTAMTMAAVMFS